MAPFQKCICDINIKKQLDNKFSGNFFFYFMQVHIWAVAHINAFIFSQAKLLLQK